MTGQGQVTIREMREGEGKTLYRLARKSFNFMEALGASVPRHALVAEVNGEVAGAMLLKIYQGRGGRKIGYLDVGFVLPTYRGQGIGGLLYPAATTWLREAGCEPIGAMVKDDNVASWGLLARQNFGLVSYLRFFRQLGLLDGLRMALRTMFFVASGMNFWTDVPVTKQSGTGQEILLAFLLMLGFQCARQGLRLLRGGTLRPEEWIAGLLVMGVSVLGGWLGTRIAGGRWRFQVPRGGIAICFVLMFFGTYYPMLGHWYPEVWEKGANGRRHLGLAALVEWMALWLLLLLARFLFPAVLLGQLVVSYTSILLIFHVLAFYPFEHFGGRRLLNWSLPLFIVLAVLTVVLFILL